MHAASSTHLESNRHDASFARNLDAADPLRHFRNEFHFPQLNGEPAIYLCGNSLGLQPKGARALLEQELNDWASLGVEAHFKGRTPWYSYHEIFREPGATLVGARPGEVVMMNSLTVNLHLMLTSFYRPAGKRTKILIEDPCFPSDIYAFKSHQQARGLDSAEHLIVARPRSGEHCLRMEDIDALLEQQGDSIALICMAGVNFLTGQAIDIARITKAGHRHGCVVGFDLAHAAGNLAMRLHEWNVDFACWCSYKYLNAGPGAVAGCFVHERHGSNLDVPRLGGWWGNDPATRFQMQLQPDFTPRRGADGWQLSNPPILAMAPLRASLELFEAAGIDNLRAKSLKLTAYLRRLLDEMPIGSCEIITPREAEAHGCQLSILVKDRPRERFKSLEAAGVMCDFREPNVIRVAPVPLYNSFHDCWRFATILAGRS